MHISLELSLRAGMFPTITVGEPGAHGAVVTGMQGMGVNTPDAADVADATEGFASDLHIPNDMIFAIGILSMMLAIGIAVITLFLGRTIREPGVIPKLHFSIAPLHMIKPICYSSLKLIPVSFNGYIGFPVWELLSIDIPHVFKELANNVRLCNRETRNTIKEHTFESSAFIVLGYHFQ